MMVLLLVAKRLDLQSSIIRSAQALASRPVLVEAARAAGGLSVQARLPSAHHSVHALRRRECRIEEMVECAR